MRVLVDVQCTQSTSSLRGIGRYALCLTRALVQHAGRHQVELLLNAGDDPARLLRARGALETFVRPGQVHVFDAPWPWSPPFDPRRRPSAEAAYSAAVRSLRPDVLLIPSVVESDQENVLTVSRRSDDPPTVAVLHDLIPALDPGTYLLGPGAASYWRRLEELKRCSVLLSNSRHSAAQATEVFGAQCPPVLPIWGGPYVSGDFPTFESHQDEAPDRELPPTYVLTVGGDHPRKNLDRLVVAWAGVPSTLRARSPLVLACRLNPGTVRRLRRTGRRHGLDKADLLIMGAVSESTLAGLYAGALLFVFPSVEEGLGMPALEAMAAGCPTLLARGSSLSELGACDEVFFDGHDTTAMAGALTRALTDEPLRDRLRTAARSSADAFTWSACALRAWAALEALTPPTGLRRVDVEPVLWSDTAAVHRLERSPAPVLVDSPLLGPGEASPSAVLAVRALLAPATALVVPDEDRRREVVATGLVEHAVLVDADALTGAAQHDFYAEYAAGLSATDLALDLADSIVDAVLDPPRWTLERPRPVWLWLDDEPVGPLVVDAARRSGIDLVSAGSASAGLAGSVDAVIVAAPQVEPLLPTLLAARRRGARVVALHESPGVETPQWCEDATVSGPVSELATWAPHLPTWARTWDRTTGWPWRGA